MDNIKLGYLSLARALEKDLDLINAALGGELLEKYRKVLTDELETLKKNLQLFNNY